MNTRKKCYLESLFHFDAFYFSTFLVGILPVPSGADVSGILQTFRLKFRPVLLIINSFFPYYFCCILQQKDTEDEGNNPVNNEYFVQIYKFSRILYCSKDPTTDCKTTNPNFNKLFDQLEPILQVLSVSLLSLFSSQTN